MKESDRYEKNDDTTLSRMTLGRMTLGRMTFRKNDTQQNAE
jgi:hypothetical protein